jgi:endonuclease III
MLTERLHIFFDEPADKGGGGDTPPVAPAAPESFEKVMEKWDEPTKKLYETHVAGLKSALTSERDGNKELNNQVKELLKKVEKGSEAERAITDLSTKLDATEKRAVFLEEANKPEIGCVNPKAAYLLAMADNLFDKRGNPDWEAIKKAAPELFGKAAPPGHAGSGTQNSLGAMDMNTILRKAAGR